ncbi:MAG: hypothetical protein HQL31_03675 [Planctomycetes bacterium]|nr:hypothetical protein [Planctomycetota bacterium]
MEKTKKLNEAYLKQSESVLSEEEQASFKQSLERDVERLQRSQRGRGPG